MKLEADKDAILKRGARLFFTVFPRRGEGKRARAGRDTAREGIIFRLVLEGLASTARSTYSLKTYRLLTANLWPHDTG